MSIHSSLRSSAAMEGHRNVLSRVERIQKLQDKGRWSEEDGSILGLPKVRSIKMVVKKKKKKDDEEAAAE